MKLAAHLKQARELLVHAARQAHLLQDADKLMLCTCAWSLFVRSVKTERDLQSCLAASKEQSVAVSRKFEVATHAFAVGVAAQVKRISFGMWAYSVEVAAWHRNASSRMSSRAATWDCVRAKLVCLAAWEAWVRRIQVHTLLTSKRDRTAAFQSVCLAGWAGLSRARYRREMIATRQAKIRHLQIIGALLVAWSLAKAGRIIVLAEHHHQAFRPSSLHWTFAWVRCESAIRTCIRVWWRSAQRVQHASAVALQLRSALAALRVQLMCFRGWVEALRARALLRASEERAAAAELQLQHLRLARREQAFSAHVQRRASALLQTCLEAWVSMLEEEAGMRAAAGAEGGAEGRGRRRPCAAAAPRAARPRRSGSAAPRRRGAGGSASGPWTSSSTTCSATSRSCAARGSRCPRTAPTPNS